MTQDICNSNYKREALITIVIFILVNILSFIQQDRISLNSGKGWDGRYYFDIAEQLSRGQRPHTDAPFVYRIGTPFLASLIPAYSLLNSFWLINSLANAVSVFLFLILLRLYLHDWRVRVLLLTLFMFQWHGPIRMVYHYPAYVDPAFFCFLMSGLILTTKLKSRYSSVTLVSLSIVMFLGAVFRESVLLIALALPFITNPVDFDILERRGLIRKILAVKASMLLPLAAVICGLAFTRILTTQTNGYSFFRTAVFWAFQKPLPSYILAWFVAFGPIVTLALYDIKGCWAFLKRQQHLLLIILGYAFLAWIGGSDTDRILFWAAPVIYILIGMAIEHHASLLRSVPLVLVLFTLQAISQRILWATPDYPTDFPYRNPFLTLIGEQVQLLDLYSFYANDKVESLSLIQYALCTLCILLWLHTRNNNRTNQNG